MTEHLKFDGSTPTEVDPDGQLNPPDWEDFRGQMHALLDTLRGSNEGRRKPPLEITTGGFGRNLCHRSGW